MSENSELPPAKVRLHRNRTKRRFSRTRLPTPPPDPKVYEELLEHSGSLSEENLSEKEKEFLEYISSLQKPPPIQFTRSDSLFAPVAVTEDAFDHLDRLYKLMEQMLNLRQQNARLQRRVRDLEHLKNLQSLRRQLDNVAVFEDIPELDDDSSFTESLLDAMLTSSKKDTKAKPWNRTRLRQSLLRKQRNRSSSLNEKGVPFDAESLQDRRRSSAGSEREKSSKVSKWTKVKAAFRWEKAAPSVSGAKSQDSGIGGMLPVNYEVARYLRVPSTPDEIGVSPADSGAADGSTPGTLSSASSADDIHRTEHRGIHGDLHCSDDDHNSITLDGTHLGKGTNNDGSARPVWVRMRSKMPSCSDVPEKHRLSTRSDDMKMDTSDNDDLTDSGQHEDIKLFKQSNKSRDKGEIPAVVIARYRQAIADDEKTNKQNMPAKRVSKWTRVKRAFLTPSNTNATSHQRKTNHTSTSTALGTNNEVHADESKRIQDEIQKNYRQLQKKLSIEFQGKLQEWEKLKASGPSNVAGAHTRSDWAPDDHRDQAFMKKMEEWQRIKAQPSKSDHKVQMIREENLAPEFKKKLEEWQKIKKCSAKDDSSPVSKTKKKLGEWPKWKSVSSHREEHGAAEHQPLSEEFLKKLEEWRKMKKHDDTREKSPSPKTSRKNMAEPSTSGQSRKMKEHDDKQLHWFENELDKIEKQKQRLEQERQKFLQREERLTKLRRTVMGDGNKKDILIHTPSGFYKFEGISRKFTQKLCEWEKAQGIGPEASTFALLTSTFTPHITVDLYETDPHAHSTHYSSSRLLRSKSAESIATPNLMQPCPSTSHHPSSLSLNDVDELEKQCLSLSRSSSAQDIDGSLEKLRNDEPEAVIVEVEDVVEETASLLEERLQEKHFPIYQREMALNTCEKQPCVIPYLERTDSKGAQHTSILIEEIITLSKIIIENEDSTWETEYQDFASSETDQEGYPDEFEQQTPSPSPDVLRLKNKNEMQKQRSDTVLDKIIRLQEIHSKNISDVAVEEQVPTSSHFSNLLEAAQDLFSELYQLTELLQNTLDARCAESSNATYFNYENFRYSNVSSTTSELIAKLGELKRILTYFYAASDMVAPGRKFKSIRKLKQEHTVTSTNTEKMKKCSSANDISTIHSNQNKQGQLVAKRMRYKKKDYCSKTFFENEDSDTNESSTKNDQKLEIITVDPVIIEKLVIPTKPNYVSISCEPCPSSINEVTPVELFVKTTRKLFTPMAETQSVKCPSQSPSSSSIDLTTPNQDTTPQSESCDNDVEQMAAARLPPLPASPTPQRKASKEISPSIRLMLAKYNQMISQQDGPGLPKSAGSSGSASPVAWRSPVSERRVKAQRERYLEEISKREVRKSASVSILNTNKIAPTKLQSCSVSVLPSDADLKINKGILRSTSASVIQSSTEKLDQSQKHPGLKLIIPENEETTLSPAIRYSKLQKAKEDFFNSPSTSAASPLSAPPLLSGQQEIVVKYPVRSRFSQISMGSESSCDSAPCEGLLIKSASAGMINVDEDTYKQIDPAFHSDGYVSLPRSVAKQKEGLLGGKLSLSNIAAKFRKVKMRRSKEQKKMNTISALCRQSLVVDINPANPEPLAQEKQVRSDSLTVPSDRGASSSEDTSPSSSRSGSWIRRSRIFKAL